MNAWRLRRSAGGEQMSEHEAQQASYEGSADHEREAERVYHYRHAGIRERDGAVPLWLMLVVLGLLIWSVYYLIQYWNPA